MSTTEEPLAYPFSAEADRLTLHPEYKRLQQERPICRIRMPYGEPAWLVTTYDDVRRVLSDPLFSRAPATGEQEPRCHEETRFGGLMTMDPPDHTRLRRFVAKAFTVRRIESVRPRVREIAEELAGSMAAAGSPTDLVDAFAFPLPVRVMCELLGVPFERRGDFKRWADALVSTTALSREECTRRGLELLEYVGELLARRRETPQEDLISWLASARDGSDRLAEAEVVNLTIGILVGAFETTANQIPNFFYLLLSDPRLLDELRDSPECIPDAVEELLRYIPLAVASAFAHYPKEDVELSGVLIRAGEPVLTSLAAANRDPRVFDEPDTVDLTRRGRAHVGFGHGFHHCLGAHLARVELQETLRVLLSTFPGLRLTTTDDTVPWKRGMFLRGPDTLTVSWDAPGAGR